MEMNSNYNPSQVHHSYWVYALEHSQAMQYSNKDGKWMMFFPMSEIDARWAEAVQLYRSGKLVGINSMKSSTAQQNPMPERLHRHDEAILIFYCGPCEDEEDVMEYGRNILDHMQYNAPTFYYKSDLPHLIRYDRVYKHMYKIDTNEHYSAGPQQRSFPRARGLNRRSASSLGLYSGYGGYDNNSTRNPYARSASAIDFNRPNNGGLYGYSNAPQSNYNLNNQFGGYGTPAASPYGNQSFGGYGANNAYGGATGGFGDAGGLGGYGGYGGGFGATGGYSGGGLGGYGGQSGYGGMGYGGQGGFGGQGGYGGFGGY